MDISDLSKPDGSIETLDVFIEIAGVFIETVDVFTEMTGVFTGSLNKRNLLNFRV